MLGHLEIAQLFCFDDCSMLMNSTIFPTWDFRSHTLHNIFCLCLFFSCSELCYLEFIL
jgi:hypothetical protein